VLVARLGVTVLNWFVDVITPDVPTGNEVVVPLLVQAAAIAAPPLTTLLACTCPP